MKFGIYSSIADPPAGENLALRVDEVVAEAKLAESVGFDSCFFGEHHQDRDGFLPSPLIVSAAVAAQTTTLNLGTSVILLPLHHPVHLAEDVITLDIVSRGRFILGVGLGYQPVDFRTFDIPIEQRVSRFEEEIEIIRQCWSGDRFDFSGEHFNLEDITIRPKPYSDPAPPAVDRSQPGSGSPSRRAHRGWICRRPKHRSGKHGGADRRLPTGRGRGRSRTDDLPDA